MLRLSFPSTPDLTVWGAEDIADLSHNQESISALCDRWTALDPDGVVRQSTGDLEVPLATFLQAVGLPVVGRYSRPGRASGLRAKTDRIDAPWQALVGRRWPVMAIWAQEKTRLYTSQDLI